MASLRGRTLRGVTMTSQYATERLHRPIHSRAAVAASNDHDIRSTLIAAVSHDLRSPLATAITAVDSLAVPAVSWRPRTRLHSLASRESRWAKCPD